MPKNITGDNNNNGRAKSQENAQGRQARGDLARSAGWNDTEAGRYGANRNAVSDTVDAIKVARARSHNSDLPMRGRNP